MMNSRLFGLIEKHHRIDEALRLARLRDRVQWMEIARLTLLKLKAKQLIHRAQLRPATA